MTRCPICHRQGTPSRAYIKSTETTLMCKEAYFDETGVWHSHDPNRTMRSLRCGNGHEWQEISYRDPCPEQRCEWNEGLKPVHVVEIS